MPLTAIDYSHTFIYKLCCKDPTITDIYIGHTTNVVKRKQRHKYCCNNSSCKDYTNYVYQFIRNTGGWCNWDMVVLVELNCNDKYETERNESKYIEELQTTLNKQIPTRTDKEYYEQNKDKIIEQQKEYYEQNKDKIAEYREKNKDKIAEYNKEYKEQNKETLTEYNKEYRRQNREKILEQKKAYREKQKALKALSI